MGLDVWACVFGYGLANNVHSYICQYIEIRRLSSIQSGQWLALQASLALIRVAVWISNSLRYNPIAPARMIRDSSSLSSSVQDVPQYSLTETRLVLLWASSRKNMGRGPDYRAAKNPWYGPSFRQSSLAIPSWALPAFRLGVRDHTRLFEVSRKLRHGGDQWEEALQVVRNIKCAWEIPDSLFMRWIELYSYPECQ